jgi:sugar transferase (PEP-CTERM/EpsH1 system associated)
MSARDSRTRTTIAHVLIGRHIGGLERVVISLIKRIDQNRFRTILCYLEEEGDWVNEVKDSCSAVKAFGKKPGVAVGLPVRLALFFRSHHVDVVHCHNFSALVYGSLGGRIARCGGILYTAHGPRIPSEKRRLVFQRLPLFDRLVAVSDDLRRDAAESLHVPSERLVTIANGVELGQFVDKRNRRRSGSMNHGAQDGVVIGCIARLAPGKDHETILAAFARVSQTIPKAQLLIVGDGPLRSHLEARVRELGLRESVQFLGTQDDIPRILSQMDVFVLASREEGLPMSVLEAMAAGVPVVATPVGGVPQLIEHGKTGLLVPPGDSVTLANAVMQLIEDKENTFTMVQNATDLVATHYDASDMVQRYEKLYDTLV